MSTRAKYTFLDSNSKHSVHISWFEPRKADKYIKNALKKAWELPRFEADEFAAAFVAANKRNDGPVQGGGVRLIDPAFEIENDFQYEVSCKDGQIWVKAFYLDGPQAFFEGYLNDFEVYLKSTKKKTIN